MNHSPIALWCHHHHIATARNTSNPAKHHSLTTSPQPQQHLINPLSTTIDLPTKRSKTSQHKKPTTCQTIGIPLPRLEARPVAQAVVHGRLSFEGRLLWMLLNEVEVWLVPRRNMLLVTLYVLVSLQLTASAGTARHGHDWGAICNKWIPEKEMC